MRIKRVKVYTTYKLIYYACTTELDVTAVYRCWKGGNCNPTNSINNFVFCIDYVFEGSLNTLTWISKVGTLVTLYGRTQMAV